MNQKNILEKIIPDKILENMRIENVYSILNENIFSFLNDDEREFVEELEKFCIQLEPTIDYEKDVYYYFPKLGEHGYIQRMNPFKNYKHHGMKYEVLLGLILSICDAELDLARLASGILCGNPCYLHNNGRKEVLQAYEEINLGTKVGCIGITEPTQGSDAVNMKTVVKKLPDGSIEFDGEKVFTTNGAKADYFACYGVYDVTKPRETMVQCLVKREFGVKTNRLGIWSTPRVHISHTFLKGVKVPPNFILGDNGEGYKILFEGLIPERISITGSGLGICWGNLIRSMLYCSQRIQFGKPIVNYQGVGFINADLFARLMAATSLALSLAGYYDKNIMQAEKPSKDDEKTAANQAAQAKYLIARLSHEISYEVQNAMGGIALTDNLKVDKTLEVSKVQEVIGGTRNVMLILMDSAIQRMVKSVLK